MRCRHTGTDVLICNCENTLVKGHTWIVEDVHSSDRWVSLPRRHTPRIFFASAPGHVPLRRGSAQDKPAEVTVALIGAGGMGVVDMPTALSIPGVRIGGVCDLYDGRLREARKTWGEDLFVTKDYTEKS